MGRIATDNPDIREQAARGTEMFTRSSDSTTSRDRTEVRSAWLGSLVRDQVTRTVTEVPRTGEIASPPSNRGRSKIGRFTAWLLNWAQTQDAFIRGKQLERGSEEARRRRDHFVRELERASQSAAYRAVQDRMQTPA